MRIIKITKDVDIFFEKLERVKKIYNIKTNTSAISHLCTLALEGNNFKK